MRIIVAKTAGFCFGVKRAVEMAFDDCHKEGTYTLGPIIHNQTIIDRLEEKGIHALEDINTLDEGHVIIRAHGVGKEVYEYVKDTKIKLIDATCPFVTKIHKLVASYREKGYECIVIGDENHPEIKGIDGWGDHKSIIIKDKEHIPFERLDITKSYLVVAQTTYKKQVVDEVVKSLLEEGYTITYEHTICTATKERQEEATLLAKQADAMVVIGSPFSSNTQKLYEICRKHCPKTYCVETKEALDLSVFNEAMTIGITAGASTPEDIINGVVEKLQTIEKQ